MSSDPLSSNLISTFFAVNETVALGNLELLLSIIGLLLLLISSALISGSEVALFGLSATDINQLKEDPEQKGAKTLALLSTPKRLLATILIANNAVNIAIVLLFTSLSDFWFSGSETLLFGILSLQTLFDIAIATILILIFGEILPKIYANRNPITVSLRMTPVLSILDQLFSPLSRPLQSLSHLLEDKLADKRAQISVDHLSQALELASQEDTTSEEKKLLEGIVTFGNTETRQVMRPRIDIFGLKSDLSYAEVLQRVTEKGYSRVPVFEDSIDKILGVLFIKDLLPHLDENDFKWQKLVRAPFFVPENKKLDDLLVDFQNQKTHLAIVVDEYGGTSGVITLEDVIEEIVGDISDEYDDIDLVYSRIDDYTYVFEGKTSLKDFYRVAELSSVELFEEYKGESETLAGFVLEITKGFPKRGEIIRFKGYTLTVESIDNRRIKQIKIGLPKTAL